MADSRMWMRRKCVIWAVYEKFNVPRDIRKYIHSFVYPKMIQCDKKAMFQELENETYSLREYLDIGTEGHCIHREGFNGIWTISKQPSFGVFFMELVRAKFGKYSRNSICNIKHVHRRNWAMLQQVKKWKREGKDVFSESCSSNRTLEMLEIEKSYPYNDCDNCWDYE